LVYYVRKSLGFMSFEIPNQDGLSFFASHYYTSGSPNAGCPNSSSDVFLAELTISITEILYLELSNEFIISF